MSSYKFICINTNIIVTGDSRFDQILERKTKNTKPLLPNKYQKTKVNAYFLGLVYLNFLSNKIPASTAASL